MKSEIKIDGNDVGWKKQSEQNAENQNHFNVINCTPAMWPHCDAIARNHGYEIIGRNLNLDSNSGVCEFIPRKNKNLPPLPEDFIFSDDLKN